MEVYHGGYCSIEHPDIRKGKEALKCLIFKTGEEVKR
jgi:hypothetical protein